MPGNSKCRGINLEMLNGFNKYGLETFWPLSGSWVLYFLVHCQALPPPLPIAFRFLDLFGLIDIRTPDL